VPVGSEVVPNEANDQRESKRSTRKQTINEKANDQRECNLLD
jgi:hypothetical protein